MFVIKKRSTQYQSLFSSRRELVSQITSFSEGSIQRAYTAIYSCAGRTSTFSIESLSKFRSTVLKYAPAQTGSFAIWHTYVWSAVKDIAGSLFLLGQRSHDDVRNWFRFQPKDFSELGIHSLVKELDKGYMVLKIMFEKTL